MRRRLETFLPRGAVLLSVLTFGGYLMGLLRDRTFARTFGAGPELDAYNAALVLPELALDVLVVAGLTAAFVPIYASARDRSAAESDRFSRAVLTASILIMAVATVVLFIFAPETLRFVAPGFTAEQQQLYVQLFRIMCVTALIFSASFAIGEMLVAHQRFLSYGLAPLLYNAGIVAGTLILGPRIGIYGAAVGTVIGAMAHLGVRLVEARHIRIPLRLKLDVFTSEFREFVLLALPKTISQPVEPLTFLYFTSVASGLVAGSVSSISFARNFQSVPVSLIGVAFAVAAFPVLSRVAASGDRSQFVRLTLSNLATILVITSAAAVVVYAVSTRVVDTFLGGGSFDAEDVHRTGMVLAAFSLSIPFESGVQLLARAFYATHNTLIPVAASILGLAVTVVVAQALLPTQGIVALPLAFTAGQALKLALLGVAFPFRVRAVGQGAAMLPPESLPPESPPPELQSPLTVRTRLRRHHQDEVSVAAGVRALGPLPLQVVDLEVCPIVECARSQGWRPDRGGPLGVPRVIDIGARDVGVREDGRVCVRLKAGHHPGVRTAPGHHHDRRLGGFELLGRVPHGRLPALVGTDLVAVGTVRVKGGSNRSRPPAAVVRVLGALPLADPTGDLALRGIRVVGQSIGREHDLGARHGTPRVLDLRHFGGRGFERQLQVDRSTRRKRCRRRTGFRGRRGLVAAARVRGRGWMRVERGTGGHRGWVGEHRLRRNRLVRWRVDDQIDARHQMLPVLADAERVGGDGTRGEQDRDNDQDPDDRAPRIATAPALRRPLGVGHAFLSDEQARSCRVRRLNDGRTPTAVANFVD